MQMSFQYLCIQIIIGQVSTNLGKFECLNIEKQAYAFIQFAKHLPQCLYKMSYCWQSG